MSDPFDAGESVRNLRAKYAITARSYDVLDYPWERQYRKWRPGLLEDVRGRVLEADVGTDRNLAHYTKNAELLGIDRSPAMLQRARRRAPHSPCSVSLREEDATIMSSIPDATFDWVVSTFMCCVMPDELQPKALAQIARVLKPGGRFRLLEMVFSEDPKSRPRQGRFAPFVERVYGARFDRQTRRFVEEAPDLELTHTRLLKADTYLLLDGRRT
jgi:ubiquinone/menaquinone biosynthesis C-methylase UbiE